MLEGVLEKVAQREDLSRDEMAAAVGAMVDGDCAPAQIAGLLIGLRVKGETVSELVGAAAALRGRSVPVPANDRPQLCTAGTGGDRKGTINLSTAAALVAAAAGVRVAKHGNRSVSSRCGSADVLNELGVPTSVPPENVEGEIGRTGFCFLMAAQYHPAMKAVAPVRQALSVRTLFNLLGPLTNPANVRCQLVGVWHPSRVGFVAEAVAQLGIERALVVSAGCGLDEISPEGETYIVEVAEGRMRESVVTSEDFGLDPEPIASIKGGSPGRNASIIRSVLCGRPGAARTGVILNAAAALYVSGVAGTLKEGAALAADLIDTGAVADTLRALTIEPRVAA